MPAEQKSGSRMRAVAAVALVVLAGAGSYLWLHDRNLALKRESAAADSKGVAAPVSVAAVRNGAFAVNIDTIGQVQAMNTVQIRSRVDGQIEKVFFKEGENVREGDLLVQLDARPFQAALDQALAKQAQDDATLKNARLDLQRYSQLAKNSFATEQQLNTQQATVASGEAQSKADQAAVENARTQLSYTRIRAPISGRIGFRQVDVGNIVHASDVQPILSIVEIDPINVVFTVPEDRIYEVQQAMALGPLETTVFTTDSKRKLATGRLTVINNQVDVASGAVQLKAAFDNSQSRLWPGQSVNVRLHVRDLDNVALIPQQAVQRGQDGLYVWLVNGQNVAIIRKIEVSMQGDGEAVVASGLAAGDRVVVDGQYRLFDNAPVAVQTGSADHMKQARSQ
jgi:membrane fusion protein, multidrug efflux system